MSSRERRRPICKLSYKIHLEARPARFVPRDCLPSPRGYFRTGIPSRPRHLVVLRELTNR